MQKIKAIAEQAVASGRTVTAKVPAWALLCLLSVVMITAGLLRGEAGIQLAKAIRVCLECIGIG